ncbi:hypothetical protein WMO40_20990 [Bacillaceae bacterium CLA-AA-H227]|uniref:Uncharacterized protein n=1 Tax=Robertmurraya yapensis (ex Hitch et al 2024) TaxID=3133160 RepID=A0ACC6SGJ0_9BACI
MIKEPRTLERRFIRSVLKKGFFITASGCKNIVTENGQIILISTSKSTDSLRISKNQIRSAIRYMQVYRTSIIKDMQCISKYSSALFGILIEIFKGESKLQTLKNGLFRLSLLGVRFYASGLEKDPFLRGEFKKLGGNFVLFNYYQLLETSFDWITWLEQTNSYALIDSGSYSDFRTKQKAKKVSFQQLELFEDELLNSYYIEGYAQFINQNQDNCRIIGFFPFDVVGDPKKTKENYQLLKQQTNATIYPVWQFTDSLEELRQLVDEEHEFIAIGGAVPYLSNRIEKVRAVLEEVYRIFPTVNFHFLGVANELLLEFPCFSADGTAFINARRNKTKKIYLEDGTRIPASAEMTTLEVIQQNLRFLMGLESNNPSFNF